ncbi:M48 family metallopeptidase, partial [Shewanella sp. KT0246]|uniref:tetratricopeptide repeat protein n=1 Tax=Shewanella sp. KT0246 TaxID=2815912 RepID=UPI001C7CC52A
MQNELSRLEQNIRNGNLALAVKQLDAMKNNFSNDDFFWYLASAVYEKTDVELAVRAMDKAILINTNNINYYYRRAKFLQNTKDYQKAKSDYKLLEQRVSPN